MNMIKIQNLLEPPTYTSNASSIPQGSMNISSPFVPQVIALLAFSITAGFNSIGPNDNRVDCLGFSNNNVTLDRASINFGYPYSGFVVTFSPQQPPNATQPFCQVPPGRQLFSTSAEFFVAMGVLSMVYVIVALIVYILFITPDLVLAKWLVIGVS